MLKINLVAVLVSAVVAFVIGGLWYSPLLFGNSYLSLRGLDPNAVNPAATPVTEMGGEFIRWLIIIVILARAMALLAIDDLTSGLVFGGLVWVVIYAALAGSVLHEGYPWRVYAFHAGDGLLKIAAITAILSLWPTR